MKEVILVDKEQLKTDLKSFISSFIAAQEWKRNYAAIDTPEEQRQIIGKFIDVLALAMQGGQESQVPTFEDIENMTIKEVVEKYGSDTFGTESSAKGKYQKYKFIDAEFPLADWKTRSLKIQTIIK